MSLSGIGTSSVSAVIVGVGVEGTSDLLFRFSSQVMKPPTKRSETIDEPIIKLSGLVSVLIKSLSLAAALSACSALIISRSCCCNATCVSS